MPQRDSVGYTIGVALVLCIFCSLGVSGAAVALKDRQEQNKLLDRQKNILDATGIAYSETGAPASELKSDRVSELFGRIEEKLVDLETGEFDTTTDPKTYDERAAAKVDSESSELDTTDGDTGFKRRENIVRVYLVRDSAGKVSQVVLPVYGKGLWSTLYGYLAIKNDLKTVQGLTFYEHGETPGLGGEVENPAWKAQWQGLELFGDDGKPVANVAKGPAAEGDVHSVDGLSGATITCRGVTNLVRYWTGEDAYGPFLEKLAGQLDGKSPSSGGNATESVPTNQANEE